MRERIFAAALLVLGLYGFALAAGMFPPAPGVAARTDIQKQAMTATEIRAIGTAMFSWLTDQVGAAAAGQPQVPVVDFAEYPEISHGDLTSLLVPQYIEEIPELDGWNHPYDLRLNTANPLAAKVMAIRSSGRDGAFSAGIYSVARFAPDNFDEDIAWADGFAVRWPKNRTDREAQEETRQQVSSVGAAMFSWLTDQVRQRVEGTAYSKGGIVVMANYANITYAHLRHILVPQYIQDLPEKDGWDGYYEYHLNTENPLATEVMAIRSNGRDLSEEGNTYTIASFDPDDFEQDIVWADGSFVRSPASGQGLPFYTLSPCRIVDTRTDSALQSGVSRLFEIGGACGVPVSASSVAVTMTVVGPTGAGYVAIAPEGTQVLASTISFAAGQTRSNNAVLGLSEDVLGSIEAKALITGAGQTHLVLDVTGYWE